MNDEEINETIARNEDEVNNDGLSDDQWAMVYAVFCLSWLVLM